jgi:hypothetical protein
MHMRIFPTSTLFVVALACTTARATIVEFTLPALNSPAYESTLAIAPKKVAEACVELAQGTKVVWSFSGTGGSDFNIHFHEGKAITYLEDRKATQRANATLTAPVKQTYCWMWTNVSQRPIEVKLSVQRTAD